MRKTNYFLFALICIFCSNVVFAKNDISIESITSVYDKNSGVLVNEVDGVHNVVFNDSNQSVKFNMNLRNNTNKDISLEDIVLPVASENFLVAKLSGAGNNYKLDANTTEKVTLSLEIVKTEDWGRNFTLSYVGEDGISNNEVTNPNTSVKEIAVILVFATFITGLLVIIVNNKRLSRYVVIVVAFGSIISVIDAKETILLPINLNISFESKNVMQKAYHLDEDENNVFEDYWSYADKIKNVYFNVDDLVVENYEYVFDVSNDDSKSVMAYLVLNSLDTNYYDLYIVSNGVIYFNEDASYYFANMKNIEGIHDLENVDTSNVTNMSRFFYYYGYNSEKVDINFDNIDTSNVTDMSVMFYKTGYSSSDVNLDLSKLDTSKVTNMASMFVGAAYNDVDFNLDVSNFDTSEVTDMSSMFNNVGYKSTVINIDFSSFDTSKVTNMLGMFCNYGRSNPNLTLDISNFDTSNVTNMYRMFMQTGYGSTQFNLSLGDFEVDSLEKADQLFYYIGYKSTNLSFSILIDNPNISSYSKMFNGVATVSGAEVVVNYTSETEELVDKMIATKSSSSNVVKGELIVE